VPEGTRNILEFFPPLDENESAIAELSFGGYLTIPVRRSGKRNIRRGNDTAR